MKNILVILTDDHAQWAMGAYGNRELNTPNLDYLAQTGVQMTNAFTPTPVCSPARACFFTGRLASQHGVHDYLSSMDPEIHLRDWLGDETTLAQILAADGYQTALCGKWHLGSDHLPQPGFEHWYSFSGDYPTTHGDSYRYSDNGRISTRHGYKNQIVTDEAVKFLRQRDEKRPFFLFVGQTTTHSPWDGHPERLVEQYRNCLFDDIPDGESYPFGEQALESAAVDRTHEREALAQYYAAVAQIDESVGRLLDELYAQKLLDDTLVVYTADHGLNCGHHGIWGKGNGTLPLNMVDESIRVPLLFHSPGNLPQAQKRDEFVDHLDLFQTLLDYADVPAPAATPQPYPGRSIWRFLENQSMPSDWRDVQFGEYGDLRTIRTERYKLLKRCGTETYELFDLETDPREMTNLAGKPEYAELISWLDAQITAYFGVYEDPVKSGLRVDKLPRHNRTEAWRTGAG